MADKLGILFLNAAMGPLNYAGQCIMQNRVKNGIGELAAESLLSAVERGIGTVSHAAGLPSSSVANLLPMNEIGQVARRIAESQRVAMEQWEVHTGHIGGLLDGIADLTIDNRSPDASTCLLRLSKKMHMDKPLAVPLRELSEDLAVWQALIASCRTFIDDGHSLASAYRQRRLVRIGATVAIALAVAVVAVWFVRVRMAQGRVEALLATDDPCVAASVDPGDLGKATDEQNERLGERVAACAEAATEMRLRQERDRNAQEQVIAVAEKKAARLRACDKLAQSLVAGSAEFSTLEEAKPHAALLARIAARAPVPADIGSLAAFPCLQTAAASKMAEQYLQGVLATAAIWMYTDAPSKLSADLIVKGAGGVTARQLKIFDRHIEEMAKRAVRTGDEARLGRTEKLCALKKRLDMHLGMYCKAAATVLVEQR